MKGTLNIGMHHRIEREQIFYPFMRVKIKTSALTNVICKLCKKVTRKRWIQFLEDRQQISARQFGFREGLSCVINLLSFFDRVLHIIQESEY